MYRTTCLKQVAAVGRLACIRLYYTPRRQLWLLGGPLILFDAGLVPLSALPVDKATLVPPPPPKLHLTHTLTLCLSIITSHSPVSHGGSAFIASVAACIVSAVVENAGVAVGVLTSDVMALTQSAHRASAALGILLRIFAGSSAWQQQATNMRKNSCWCGLFESHPGRSHGEAQAVAQSMAYSTP